MKRYLNILGIILAISINAATSCVKTPFLTLSTPKTINFTDQGGTQSITFTANRDWSVSSSDTWIKVSPSFGNKIDGNITVTLTCEPNTTYDPRISTLTVRVEELSETITVTQDTNLGLLVSPTSYDLTNAAQLIEVEIRANVSYTVEIDDACKEWIKQEGTRALSTDKISFSISANETYDDREGIITIKQTGGSLYETIVVKQSKTKVLSFTEAPFVHISGEAQTLDLHVNANVGFSVDVESDYDWIYLVETKGLVTSTITIRVDANDRPGDRVGIIIVRENNGQLIDLVNVQQHQLVPDGAVDLGLTVFWGKCNIGATTPEEYGGYYAWGETETKENYSWDTYKWTGEDLYILKYCPYESVGKRDERVVLEPLDDVAYTSLGGKWRMPTAAELKELVNLCEHSYTSVNGVYGVMFTSKSNGNSIFLPAAGYMENDEVVQEGILADYWSATLLYEYPHSAMSFRNSSVSGWNVNRYNGLPIRPVASR